MPSSDTICMGAEENEVILEAAYLIRDQVDHLDSPMVRSLTSNSMVVEVNPIQEESARKKAFFSFMFSKALTAFRSSSLKSDALDISISVIRLRIL